MLNNSNLNIHHLSFARLDRYLFKDLNIQLIPGEILQVQGENGSGKSTLLRILAGLIEQTSGTVTWENESIFNDNTDYKKVLRYLSDKNGLKGNLTIEENLRLARVLCPIQAPSPQPSPTLTQGEGVLRIEHLSLGQRRRASFMRILQNPGKIWILDEPMTGLDKKTQEWLVSLMENHLGLNGIIIIATHQPIHIKNTIKTIQLGESSVA